MNEVPPLIPLATAALHVGEPERILEVECGEGDGTLFLAREFPRASVRGVDADEATVRRAAGRIGLDPEGRVAFKAGGPRRLPFPDDHFDLVALLDAAPAPRELARVLRPGGYLLVARSAGDADQGLGARLRGWRLRRAGFEPIWSEAAGAGGYAVARLRAA
ncbi:MAG TPA: class I SAM-dependent methyltransferase [Solirubrobacterales bacterium]|jgi:ubiquinone/menaquinone biosynthesis C-methylase UbiE